MPDVLQTYYVKLPAGPPTQGDIWTNLPSPFSNLETGVGVLITPRCDLIHDNARFVNYLPLVPFQDYLYAEGGFELLEQELDNAKDRAEAIGRELGIDRLLGAGVSLSEALAVAQNTMDSNRWNSPKLQARVGELRNVADKADVLSRKLAETRLDPETVATFIGPKLLARYKKQIAHNAFADLHFLPPCPPLFRRAVVVLLRCIGTCGVDVIKTALNSVTPQDWARALEGGLAVPHSGFREKPDRVARLRSPYLEALMARFGALFTRVGTRDIPDAASAAMLDAEG